jgi:predicted transcriptional regulator
MGALELEILRVLWTRGEPMAPAEVRAAHGGDLGYTTVTTVLARLHQKELVVRNAEVRVSRYEAAMSEADYGARRMLAALDRADDHPATLARFLRSLDRADVRTLRRRLERTR